jgi:hypothetical protein
MYNVIYFTSEVFMNPQERNLFHFLGNFAENFVTFPGLLVPENGEEMESTISEIYEKNDDSLLFVGIGMNGYWANWFANRFLSPRILFNPILNPADFFTGVGDRLEAERVKSFDEKLNTSPGVPGLILCSPIFSSAASKVASVFQVEEFAPDQLYNFSKNSSVCRVIANFINDLGRFAI